MGAWRTITSDNVKGLYPILADTLYREGRVKTGRAGERGQVRMAITRGWNDGGEGGGGRSVY